MLITDFTPLRRFIATDVLNQNNFNKYTVGYIYYAYISTTTDKPYARVSGLVTRIGKTGKPRIKHVDFYAAPLVYTELIEKHYYEGITHVLTKISPNNVLKKENLDFLAWYYANILYIEKKGVKRAWPNALDKTSLLIKRMARDVESYSAKQIENSIGSDAVRTHLIVRLRSMYAFVKHYMYNEKVVHINRPSSGHMTMALKHHKTIKDEKIRNTVAKHIKIMTIGKQLPEELLMENKNVSQEYEDSGYWV